MPLATCIDCHQPVSTEAVSCPTCGRPMRDRSYLTPMGQVVVGGVVVIACFAFPPLFVFVLMVFGGRFLRDLARRSASSAGLAIVLLLAVGVGSAYLLQAPGLGAVVMAATLGGCVWLVATHVRARSQVGTFSSATGDLAAQTQHQLRGQ
jgi:hypothetical protein